MRRLVIVLLILILVSCGRTGVFSKASEEEAREYSATAVSLSDFSMKIVAHYQSQNLPIPVNFDAEQFFALLKKIYPDQSRVSFVRANYKVSARPVNGGYSVMLCDPRTDRKIMEDLSCCLDRVEIRSWQSNSIVPCISEHNWKPLCKCE